MSYTHLLFDADGTLFDYDRAESAALAATFAASGIAYLPEYVGVYRGINGRIWEDFERGAISQQELRSARFARLFQAIDVQADAHAFSEAYLVNLSRASQLIDGVVDIVMTLHKQYHLALITNGIPEVQRSRLARSPIASAFDAVIISGEIGVAKPDPAIFDALFAALDHPPRAQTLIIGDSLTSDIQGGINYGIDTCWYNPNHKPPHPTITPTYEIPNLAHLPTFLNPQ